MTAFCNRLGWYNMELLLTQFQSRLSFGVQRELVDLVRISALNAQRARAVFDAGYQSIAALATADVLALELVIRNSAPFLRFISCVIKINRTKSLLLLPLPVERQHPSYGDCLEVRRENNPNSSVLYCVRQLCTVICTYVNSS